MNSNKPRMYVIQGFTDKRLSVAYTLTKKVITTYFTNRSFINCVTRDAAFFDLNLPPHLSSRSTFSEFVVDRPLNCSCECTAFKVHRIIFIFLVTVYWNDTSTTLW